MTLHSQFLTTTGQIQHHHLLEWMLLHQDLCNKMDGKSFLSIDANGSETGWKINRGWAMVELKII